MRLGIVTCAKCRELTPSERPLLSLLEPHGIQATPVVWNDPAVDWASFSALLVRSVWDYHLHPKEFNEWLDRLDQQQIPVWNPTGVLRWNSHKFYLRDLAERDVHVVPTLYLERGCADGQELGLKRGWTEVVVKPAVSASGYRTHVLSLRDPEAKLIFSEIAEHGDFLLQPFQPSILETGEVSMVFFDNVYSHAVLKRPRNDDFRVQAEHGGTESAHDPDPSVIQAAQQILDKTVMPWLYARVDGLVVVGEFHLMELELIEPDLFLDSHPDARSRLVSAILRKVKLNAKL